MSAKATIRPCDLLALVALGIYLEPRFFVHYDPIQGRRSATLSPIHSEPISVFQGQPLRATTVPLAVTIPRLRFVVADIVLTGVVGVLQFVLYDPVIARGVRDRQVLLRYDQPELPPGRELKLVTKVLERVVGKCRVDILAESLHDPRSQSERPASQVSICGQVCLWAPLPAMMPMCPPGTR